MNRNGLSIATMTLVRDEDEEQLLRRSLTLLASFGIPVIITDGGSNAGFMDFLRSLSNFELLPQVSGGVWSQARKSLMQASRLNLPFTLYTEPDKQQFFELGLKRFLDEVTVDDQSGVVLASRSAESFATFPDFQRMTETTINNCCAEITGISTDYTYGPFILNTRLLSNLDLMDDGMGWGWRPYFFGLATRLGYRLESFVGDFSCPPLQREDSARERIYRMSQLSQNIEGLVRCANIRN